VSSFEFRPGNRRVVHHALVFVEEGDQVALLHAGIDEQFVYGRLDFAGKVPEDEFEIVVNLESWTNQDSTPRRELRLETLIAAGGVRSWKVTAHGTKKALATSAEPAEAQVALARNFEFRVPLVWLQAAPIAIEKVRGPQDSEETTRLRLRFSLWSNRLPVDALPVEGWIELEMLREEDLTGQ